ncbi:hypothetical protein ACJIZ3_023956 [Penstemon smallii]|uniref:Uncharacterized protein n=1 Tax=Penstemon smallii TaxID=265156 RepID=A0ABD3TST8_9LAMI
MISLGLHGYVYLIRNLTLQLSFLLFYQWLPINLIKL